MSFVHHKDLVYSRRLIGESCRSIHLLAIKLKGGCRRSTPKFYVSKVGIVLEGAQDEST
jgi:hypothetical protein